MRKITLYVLLFHTSLLLAPPPPPNSTSLVHAGSQDSSTDTSPLQPNASFSSKPATLAGLNAFLEEKRDQDAETQCIASMYAGGAMVFLVGIILAYTSLAPTQQR